MKKAYLIYTAIFALIFSANTLKAQTEIAPTYSVDGRVYAMESIGDTLIMGGNFRHVGKHTGGGAYFSTSSDQPVLTFPKLIGYVFASCSDGNGGFYIYGNYYRESETLNLGRSRIEHILSDFTFEPNFSLTVNTFGIYKLLFNNGILYMGGWNLTQVAGQNVGNLCAINVNTQLVQSWIPSVVLTNNVSQVTNMMISRGTLYIVGLFTDVGGVQRKNAAAIQIGTGTVRSWNPTNNWGNAGYSDLLVYNNTIILSGGFNNPDFSEHAGAIVDTLTGLLSKYLFKSGGLFGNNATYLYWAANVNSLALKGDILYAYSIGTFDTRVTAVNLLANAPYNVLWMKYFNMIANAKNMTIIGNSLYLAGSGFENVYKTDSTNAKSSNIERKVRNIVRLNTITGNLENWFPDPVGSLLDQALTMSANGTNLFFGGYFTHVNGLDRAGLLMLKNSTQTVLPFSINDSYGYFTTITALKIKKDTLYFGGGLMNLSAQNSSIASYNIKTGIKHNWNPVFLGNVFSIETNDKYVFVGGALNEPSGGAGRTNLFAIDRQTGNLNSWSPNPNDIVYSLHIRNNKLYVGGSFQTISSQSRPRLAAHDLSNLTLTAWNPRADNNSVGFITSINNNIWVGGNFGGVGDSTRRAVAALDEISGSVKRYPKFPNYASVRSLNTNGNYMIMGGYIRLSDTAPCNGLLVYDMFNKTFLNSTAFCVNIGDLGGNIYSMAKIGNDLYFGGDFTKVNGKAIATNIGRVRFPVGYFNDTNEYISKQNGNWTDPNTWQVEYVPPVGARIRLNNTVTLDQSTSAYYLKYGIGGSLKVNNNQVFKITN